MNTRPRRYRSHCPAAQTQRGVILVMGLFFLLAIVLLSLAMARGYGGAAKVAGNTQDKQKSFEAAQNALDYGEWWVGANASGAISVSCNTANSPTSNLGICSNPLTAPATLPWPAWTSYHPANMNVAAGGGVVASAAAGVSGDINYQSNPGLYVSFVGYTPDGTGTLYQVTAFSTGGSYETESVVKSTYKLQAAGKYLGGP